MNSYFKNIQLFRAIIFFGLLPLLVSCEEDSNSFNQGGKPNVEAYLVANRPITIKVKKEIAYSDDLSNKETFITGLNIKITGGGETYNLKQVQDTLYKSEANVKLKIGVTYSLSFDYNGKTVSASTIIPERPIGFTSDIKSIVRTKIDLSAGGFPGGGGGIESNTDANLTWSNPNNSYFFVSVDNIEETPRRIVTLATSSSSNSPRFNFTSEPVQGTGTRVRAQQFQYFGKHNLVLLRVNPDYVALYQTSGTTSQNISTPPSSITNGLGIFTGINADTLAFLVKER